MLRLSGYRPEFRVAEDYDFWLRSIPESRIANIDKVVCLLYLFAAHLLCHP